MFISRCRKLLPGDARKEGPLRRSLFFASAGPERCMCGHLREAHEHWRDGSDCGSCPEGECSRYRRPRRFRFRR